MTQDTRFPKEWNHGEFGWLDYTINSALKLRMDMNIYESIDGDRFYHRYPSYPPPDDSKLIYKILWKPTIEQIV